jgi:hypothetical protein
MLDVSEVTKIVMGLWSLSNQLADDGRVGAQSTYIPRVPQCMSTRWNWDPPPPSPASECATPPVTKGGGAHSPAGEGMDIWTMDLHFFWFSVGENNTNFARCIFFNIKRLHFGKRSKSLYPTIHALKIGVKSSPKKFSTCARQRKELYWRNYVAVLKCRTAR